MAKPKIDFKQLFMEKGEKITIIAAGVLMLLFLTLGIVAVATSDSTDGHQKSILEKVTRLENEMRSAADKSDPLDQTLMDDNKLKFETFVAKNFRETNMHLDLVLDNAKRGRPVILTPDEFQVDLIRAPIYVYHFSPDREKIYIVKENIKNPNLGADTFKNRKKRAPANPNPNPPAMPAGPGMQGAGAGGAPNGGSGGGPPAGMMGPGAGGAGMMGPGAPGGTSSANLKDLQIEPVDISKFDPAKMRPAHFIKPTRMVVVSASFPYKNELEEFRKALRLNSVGDLITSRELPEFRGFIVQRRVKSLDGSKIEQDWTELDWLKNYAPIYQDKDEINADDDKDLVQYKIIPELSTQLCLPLPQISRGKYPDVKIANITNAVEKLKKNNEIPKTGAQGSGRFKGDDGPFGKPNTPASGSSTEKPPTPDANAANSIQDAILIRFVDVNIIPNFTYEYRIQMKVANPNFSKDKQVGRPDDALVEELKSQPADVVFMKDGRKTTGISVPQETYVYASPRPNTSYLTKDVAKLQIQTWVARVQTDKTNINAIDEVGDWVVEDIDVPRGQWVYGSKNVKLPVWDPKHDHYQFKDMRPGKPGSSGTASAQKGMVPIDMGANSILVDFEGGKSQQYIKGKTVQDEPGVEALLMTADGRLIVRTAAADKHEASRVAREKEWLAWQDDTKKATDSVKPAGANDPFGPKPGAGGPGGGKGGTNN